MQDIANKGEFTRETYSDLREKLGVDAKLSGGIMMFSGSASLKLDTETSKINKDDLKTMNESRQKWLNDSYKSEDITTKVHEKALGEMKFEQLVSKTLDLYLVDERELTSLASSIISRSVSKSFEGLGVQDVTNLALRPSSPSASQVGLVPIAGKVEYVGRAETVPTDYLIADGRDVSRDDYPELFQKIGTIYGPGDGLATFKLPDYRGIFGRGADNMNSSRGGRGVDPGRVVGSSQNDSIARHGHKLDAKVDTSHVHYVVDVYHIRGAAWPIVAPGPDFSKNNVLAHNAMIAGYPYGATGPLKPLPDGVNPEGPNAGPLQPRPFEGGNGMENNRYDKRWAHTTAEGNPKQPVEGSVGELTHANQSDETRPRNIAEIVIIRAR